MESFTVDRTGRGLLRLSGPQAVWFLENTVTAPIEPIGEGRWAESCFLTPKGKLVAHFRVGVLAEEIWLDVDPPVQDLADWLVRYRFRTKVEIEDRSTTVTTVVGPPAEELAGRGALGRDGEAVIFGGRLGHTPVADIHGDAALAEGLGLRKGSMEEYETLRVESGVPVFGVDYTSDNLPQEAGLTSTLSVDKGCYVGQETVARIHFRGHVNKTVRTLRFDDGDPAAVVGRPLAYEGAAAGHVTSAVKSSEGGVVGIGMVQVALPEGAELSVKDGGKAVVGPVPEGTKTAHQARETQS